MLRATLKSLLARKLRLILSGLAVVLGVMSVSGALVLTDTLRRSFDAVSASAYSETDVGVSAKPAQAVAGNDDQQGGTLSAAAVQRIRSVPGVASATGRVATDGARVIGADGKVATSAGSPRLGVNWTGDNPLVQLRSGRGPAAADEIAVNAATAKAAKISVGDRVGVLTSAPKKEFTLVGIYGYSGERDSLGGVHEVAFTEQVAQRLMLGDTGAYNDVTVRATDGVAPTVLRDRIGAALGAGYVVRTGDELADESAAALQKGLGFLTNVLLGFAGVALFVGIFLILNTFSIIVAQRTRELALMRAIGANRRQVIGSVITEAIVLGLVASVLGLAAGVGTGAALAYLFSTVDGGLELAGIGVPRSAVISAFAVGIVVTVLAATLPALRASRISPVAAMQDVATPDRPLTRVTAAGALFGAVGGALLAVGLRGRGDATLTIILSGVLICFVGIALLTPFISKPLVWLLGLLFAWSLPGRLGRLNSARNPRRTAITAAALMVGIALVTGVTVVMDSAKSSLAARAEATIKAEVIIFGERSGQRPPTFDPAVLRRAAEIPGVRAAAGVWSDRAVINGERHAVTATDDLGRLADAYGATAVTGSLTRLRDNEAALSTEAAGELGVSVGGRLAVQLSKGAPHDYTVVAVYANDALPGNYLLPASVTADFAVSQPVRGLVRLDDGTAADEVLPRVNALLVDSPEVAATDRGTFISHQAGALDTVVTMIQVLLALAILIAVLGVVNTLALSVLERTRELGLLRAVGLTRAQTMRMVTVEAVVISLFGALLGVAVGAGLGAAVVQALKSGGITDLVLPWRQMAIYLLLASVVGVAAAVLPAVRAARLNVLRSISHN